MVDAQHGVEMTFRRHMNSQGTRGSGLRRIHSKVEHYSCEQDRLCLEMHAAPTLH